MVSSSTWTNSRPPTERPFGNRLFSKTSWPLREAAGAIRVAYRRDTVTKSITAGADLHHCSERRISRVLDLVVHCAELPIRSGNINWIEVEYPASNIEVAGVSVHWAICAALASIAGWLLPRVLGRRG